MLCSRILNNKTDRPPHKWALSIVCSDYISSFTTFLGKHSSFSIHDIIIQILAVEIYKFLDGLSPSIMVHILKLNSFAIYNLRICKDLCSRKQKTLKRGTEIISFLAPKIWVLVCDNIKICTSLSFYKINIRKLKPACTCCLCK